MIRDLFRSFVLPMAFMQLYFGSKSSSSSATSTSSVTTATDGRTVADNGAVVVRDGSTANVTVTDLDAVKSAADVAQAAVLGATQIATQASANAGAAFTQLKDAYSMANEQAQSVASGNKTIATVGLVIAGVIGLQFFARRKGRA